MARLSDKIRKIETHYRSEIGNNANPVVKREFHGFCDASLNDYGIAFMLKLFSNQGTFQSELSSSKSRVAPLKQETIPRLDVLGAYHFYLD